MRERLGKGGRKPPSQTTFEKWCAQNQWVRLAREHDEKVATRVADKIAETATAQAITRAMQFDTLATETLQMAIDGLKELDVAGLKATEKRTRRRQSAPGSRRYCGSPPGWDRAVRNVRVGTGPF